MRPLGNLLDKLHGDVLKGFEDSLPAKRIMLEFRRPRNDDLASIRYLLAVSVACS